MDEEKWGEEEELCVVKHELIFTILYLCFLLIKLMICGNILEHTFINIIALEGNSIIQFLCQWVWCREKAKENIFSIRMKLELLLTLNHCDTSWVKDFVNRHSIKVLSTKSFSAQKTQLPSGLMLNQNSFFFVTTIL